MAFLQILILSAILGLFIGAFTLLLAGCERAERTLDWQSFRGLWLGWTWV